MASERVTAVVVQRHTLDSERSFSDVREGIFTGISTPDISQLFPELAESTSYDQLKSLVEQAQGSAGLMRFMELDLGRVVALDPQAEDLGVELFRDLVGGGIVVRSDRARDRVVGDAGAPVRHFLDEDGYRGVGTGLRRGPRHLAHRDRVPGDQPDQAPPPRLVSGAPAATAAS